MGNEKEELLPVSPISSGYLFPEIDQIMFCSLGLAYPIDIDAVKSAFSNSVLVKHPRFSSLAIKDHQGRDCWKKFPSIDMDDHTIIHHHGAAVTTAQEKEDAVNAYIADIAVSTPLRRDKPLWDLHLLIGLDCLVLRVHHSIGDGESLMSLLSLCFGAKSVDGDGAKENVHDRKRASRNRGLWSWIKSLWFTLDKKTVISGGDGVELWPRKVVTAKFKVKDMKAVKQEVPDATINDVLLGAISCGLSEYLNLKSPKDMLDSIQLTCPCMVNMRKASVLQEEILDMSIWGNKISFVLVPFMCQNGLHPLQHLRRIKAIMDRKKKSFESRIVYNFVRLHPLLALLGSQVTVWLMRRYVLNTSFVISNIVGPPKEIAIAGNPVTYIRVTISSLPYAIVMHMVSYAGRGDLQLIVAKDIVDDPEFLAKSFEVALSKMVNYK
ncbi:Wax ester synthase/diacylglycerol acyltransferase 11-like protein [Drosera capensis]